MKKSFFSPTFLRTLCVSSLLAILSACGSGSSSSPQPVTPPPVTVVPAAKHTATAFFSLAPVDAGICRMYRLTDVANVADLSTVTALASAVSVAGSVSFPDLDYTGPALIECTGGTYDDEATPGADTTNAPSGLRSVVEVTTNGAYVVTLVTHAAAYLARDNLSAALGDNGTNQTVADLFGLDGMDITTEKPIDLNTTNATNTSASKYALVLAALSQLDKDDGSSDPDAFVRSLEADLADADGLNTEALKQALRTLVLGDSAAASHARVADSPVHLVDAALGAGANNLVPATGVEISGSSAVTVGGQSNLKAAVLPTNASSPLVNWSSSDAAIASISADGVLTAHQAGQVVITAIARATASVNSTHVLSIVAKDISAPTLTLKGASNISLVVGATYTEQGATAVDNIDGDLTQKIVVAGDAVNAGAAGTYVVTYNVSDSSGNAAAQITRTVTVTAPQVSTPDTEKPVTTANVASGTYNQALNITFTANEAGADIFYSLNGGTAQKYLAPVVINATTTLSFYAVDKAGNKETAQTRTYTLNLPPVLKISPTGGEYGDPVTVQVSASGSSGVVIRCTVDGSKPNHLSPIYQTVFAFKQATTLRCVGTDASGLQSGIASSAYTFKDTTPPVIANHRNISVLVNESIHDETTAARAPSLNALASDNLTSSTKLQFKIANYADLPKELGISLGMDGANSANYAMARPNGNDIHVHPAANYAGQATVVLQARDEAGNESAPLSFVVVAAQAGVDSDGDGLPNEVEAHLEMDPLLAGDDIGSNSEEDQYLIHVLNRLTYGPTPQLLEEARTVGIDNWIAGQLSPKYIPTQGSFAPEDDLAQYLRDKYRFSFDANHLFESVTDRYAGFRPVLSKQHLQTVMGQFWDNHFSTNLRSHFNPVAELYEEDMFFENAFGSFEKLVALSAKSFAMLNYLNGINNKRGGPNEDFGREILELHTMGVEGGYTEDDVVQMSRVFTGWSHSDAGQASRFQVVESSLRPGSNLYFPFQFKPSDHDDGLADYAGKGASYTKDKEFFKGTSQHQIIESRTSSDGVKEGEEAIAMLARHPSTARFICTKLAVKFVSESPTDETLNACTSTFRASQEAPDQIAQVLATLFDSQQFKAEATRRAKLKDAQELLYGFVRMLVGAKDSPALSTLGTSLGRMRMQPFGYPAPDGWSELSDAWLSGNQMLLRQREVNTLIPQIASMREYAEANGLRTGRGLIAHFFLLMLGGNYTNEDILLAYKQLYATEPFDLEAPEAEAKLRNLLRVLASHPNYNLQ